ncbi:PAXNEB protein-domain-containing protein [Xylariaceae sp. FL0662B]|nr:PAXNEB protein-domain-containing protein [Xylariaceae sp. FL0662B]
MSFRKRNAVINSSSSPPSASLRAEKSTIPGVRPSPLDGRPTTSTGTASLDNLLAGHSGLPLGTSLLIEEHGTTDFAGVLLRYYAAQGMVHGHQIHVLGLHQGLRIELPGLATQDKSSAKSETPASDKMKIAWRYESLGSAGAPRDRGTQPRESRSTSGSNPVFCHSFDLTKRLSPSDVKGQIGFYPTMDVPSLSSPTKDSLSPFKRFINDISSKLANSPPLWNHRIIIPNLLSPTVYSSSTTRPEEVLQFLHALRALLRQYPDKVTALITLPLSLYPRTTGLTRWMELLCDGVLELIPLQSTSVHAPPPSSKSGSKSEEQMQGLLKVHTLPIFHEKGGGSSDTHSEDQSFSVSRSKGLTIKPFHLPPRVTETDLVAGRIAVSGIMAASTGPPPLRISKVAGRYLLFDIDDIMYLRRNHNICSVFVGTIPQSPQQNIFMGLPIELLPEEAQVLVDKKIGYVVDDAVFHLARLSALDEPARRGYLQSIKSEGKKAQMEAIEYQQRTKPKKRPAKAKPKDLEALSESTPEKNTEEETIISLFDSPSTTTPSEKPVPNPPKAEAAAELPGFAITPTTSSLLLSTPPPPPPPEPDVPSAAAESSVDVPSSYALYAHLQDRGYFMMPGLRFGCDYNVYPGDPLRFHSHFQATSYGWDEEISILDLTASGRLGTTVKKGYLIGGAVGGAGAEDGTGRRRGGETAAVGDGGEIAGTPSPPPPVRAFCIEWAAM